MLPSIIVFLSHTQQIIFQNLPQHFCIMSFHLSNENSTQNLHENTSQELHKMHLLCSYDF